MCGAGSGHYSASECEFAAGEERNLPETGDEREIEVEDVLQPLDGGSGLVCEDLDQVRAGLVSGGLEGVIVELLDAILDAEIDLGAGESTVDAGRGLCRVTTEEVCIRSIRVRSGFSVKHALTLLVEEEDVATVEVDSVSSAQTGHCSKDAPSAGFSFALHRPPFSMLELRVLTSTTDDDDALRSRHGCSRDTCLPQTE